MLIHQSLMIIAASLTLLTGCSGPDEEREVVRFHDRNGDGKVDIERHQFVGFADLDWELRDDNFDGKYEARWHSGVRLTKTPVNLPIPTNVVISPE